MKTEELRELDADELDGKLKDARRELYELRFKLAVGQLDNHRQIRRVRKDIAQILTIVHQRRWEGWEEVAASGQAPTEVEEAPGAAEAVDTPEAEEAETAETEAAEAPAAEAAEAEAKPAPRRGRARARKADQEEASEPAEAGDDEEDEDE
jgi:large subunit ribosomal protein L29